MTNQDQSVAGPGIVFDPNNCVFIHKLASDPFACFSFGDKTPLYHLRASTFISVPVVIVSYADGHISTFCPQPNTHFASVAPTKFPVFGSLLEKKISTNIVTCISSMIHNETYFVSIGTMDGQLYLGSMGLAHISSSPIDFNTPETPKNTDSSQYASQSDDNTHSFPNRQPLYRIDPDVYAASHDFYDTFDKLLGTDSKIVDGLSPIEVNVVPETCKDPAPLIPENVDDYHPPTIQEEVQVAANPNPAVFGDMTESLTRVLKNHSLDSDHELSYRSSAQAFGKSQLSLSNYIRKLPYSQAALLAAQIRASIPKFVRHKSYHKLDALSAVRLKQILTSRANVSTPTDSTDSFVNTASSIQLGGLSVSSDDPESDPIGTLFRLANAASQRVVNPSSSSKSNAKTEKSYDSATRFSIPPRNETEDALHAALSSLKSSTDQTLLGIIYDHHAQDGSPVLTDAKTGRIIQLNKFTHSNESFEIVRQLQRLKQMKESRFQHIQLDFGSSQSSTTQINQESKAPFQDSSKKQTPKSKKSTPSVTARGSKKAVNTRSEESLSPDTTSLDHIPDVKLPILFHPKNSYSLFEICQGVYGIVEETSRPNSTNAADESHAHNGVMVAKFPSVREIEQISLSEVDSRFQSIHSESVEKLADKLVDTFFT